MRNYCFLDKEKASRMRDAFSYNFTFLFKILILLKILSGKS